MAYILWNILISYQIQTFIVHKRIYGMYTCTSTIPDNEFLSSGELRFLLMLPANI